jgi:uncharacterized membrane protein
MPRPIAEYVPQTRKSRLPLLFWLITVAVALIYVALIVAAPLAAANEHPHVALSIYRPFATVCHQMPDRSFFISGKQLAVCARCSGLYAGFFLMLLLYPLLRPLRSITWPDVKWLFIAAVPTSVDFFLTFFGIWENTHSSRFFTGMLLGGVTVLFVMPGISELSLKFSGSQTKAATIALPSKDVIAAAPSDYSAPDRRI